MISSYNLYLGVKNTTFCFFVVFFFRHTFVFAHQLTNSPQMLCAYDFTTEQDTDSPPTHHRLTTDSPQLTKTHWKFNEMLLSFYYKNVCFLLGFKTKTLKKFRLRRLLRRERLAVVLAPFLKVHFRFFLRVALAHFKKVLKVIKQNFCRTHHDSPPLNTLSHPSTLNKS